VAEPVAQGAGAATERVSNGGQAIEAALGETIRAARRDLGLSTTAMAERCGISQPYLSQLENGKASPSINTLYRIANALGLGPQELLPRSEEESIVIRAGTGDQTPIEDRPDAASARVLLGSPGRMLAAQEVAAEPGDDLGGWWEHDGEELVYVLEGEVGIELRHRPAEHLSAGDLAWYPARTPHRWRSLDNVGARILVVNAVAPDGSRPHR
jgi:transcriptional regulator with XRE-family HTH domain